MSAGEGDRPAFYALSPGGWRDYWSLLHPPYTAWHLSYVVIGAALAPHVQVRWLLETLLAFFLAMGVAAHALDELNGRPLRTRIPDGVLWTLAGVGLAGAVALGIDGTIEVSPWIWVFIVVGAFLVVAYNLELFGGRFHSDFWFAAAWGAFPAFTGYWVNALSIDLAGLLVTGACFAVTVAQRRLSTPVRELRRRTAALAGTHTLADGTTRDLSPASVAAPLDGALRALSIGLVLLAAGLVAVRL